MHLTQVFPKIWINKREIRKVNEIENDAGHLIKNEIGFWATDIIYVIMVIFFSETIKTE